MSSDNNINNNTNNNNNNGNNITITQKKAMDRVFEILHPQHETIGDYTWKGAKFGLVTGVAMGLAIPVFFKNTDRVSSLLKSVINMTFIGTSYQATSYFLDHRMFIPGISNALASGAVSCGITSGLLGGMRQAPVGAFAGSVIAGTGHLVYRAFIAKNPAPGAPGSQLAKAKELTDLINKNNLKLSPIDTSLYNRLVEEVSRPEQQTATEYLKSLSPFREIAPNERTDRIARRSGGQLEVPGAIVSQQQQQQQSSNQSQASTTSNSSNTPRQQ
ncbi:hypothetical protein PPL_07662 [Heterostelium album PN500]|uniref:Uncharacterized protein n=1 Tax=Heterostelium pallidum (strain ATCC 26659 / Pp 5 / PN500) TaxID=670386 RepID=D3BGL0_HETP5|nr:hypothetical protein PPL_07662 [Heterostelium album PN500]EFA79244.1 hypothetical protein PPL_07662 [Heterostelium album PN500]|eukprot:XP_020431365.1 hypothetical protein PPL_07662 [Heterostelium album PN500]